MINIGLRIKEMRERKGITKKDLCERVQCTFASLSRWESGKRNPTFESVERIANALGVSISELCGEKREELQATAIFYYINNLGENEVIVFCSNCKHVLRSNYSLNYCEKCGARLRRIVSASGKIEFDPIYNFSDK